MSRSQIAFRFGMLTIACMAVVVAGGCAKGRSATTQPVHVATDVDPQTATAEYWLDRDSVTSVKSVHYEHLFNACNTVLRERDFLVDRSDYRNGIVTSRPLVSQQLWEFWREDVGTVSQQWNSSLGTYRRTVHWTITPTEGGAYVATPKVVVERFTAEPHRITAVTSYRSAANSAAAQTRLESPRLEQVRASQWYAVGRDQALERKLAEQAQDWLLGE